MMPTSVLPSGVMARPSMPLLVTRPTVFEAISTSFWGLRVVIAKLSGSLKDRMR